MNPSAPRDTASATAPPRQIWKAGLRGFAPSWFAHVLFSAALLLCSPTLRAQNQDAISREVSVFNFGQLGLSVASAEAISREVSVFNFGQLGLSTAGKEAISREVSVFNFGQLGLSTASTEAISREVSVFNFGQLGLSTASKEAISREVSVYNYGVPPLNFAVGSTNILGNQVSQVPFSLLTLLDLTNLSLALLADDSRLQLLGVTPASPEVLAATLGTAGANGHPISFTLNPAAIPPTNHTLAFLNFQGITTLGSAVVPLTVSNLTGLCANGESAPGVVTNGEVIMIVSSPILFPSLGPPFGFTMFGVPGATYSIQATTNLVPPVWLEVERLLESGSKLTVGGLATTASQQFYRVEQVGP